MEKKQHSQFIQLVIMFYFLFVFANLQSFCQVYLIILGVLMILLLYQQVRSCWFDQQGAVSLTINNSVVQDFPLCSHLYALPTCSTPPSASVGQVKVQHHYVPT